jgi:hypothetical protein
MNNETSVCVLIVAAWCLLFSNFSHAQVHGGKDNALLNKVAGDYKLATDTAISHSSGTIRISPDGSFLHRTFSEGFTKAMVTRGKVVMVEKAGDGKPDDKGWTLVLVGMEGTSGYDQEEKKPCSLTYSAWIRGGEVRLGDKDATPKDQGSEGRYDRVK